MFYYPGDYISDLSRNMRAYLEGVRAGRPRQELDEEFARADLAALNRDIDRLLRAREIGFWVELGVIALTVGGLAVFAWRLYG